VISQCLCVKQSNAIFCVYDIKHATPMKNMFSTQTTLKNRGIQCGPPCVKLPQYIQLGPNVMVKWLALLLHIWEIPDSNLGLKTNHPA
jgi:hypothetical protein